MLNIGLITARGGSKGIPRKNIVLLNNRPLISWTIDEALNSESIDLVFVSTDDAEISAVSKLSGANVIDRPPSLAKDTSRSEDAILHAIDSLKNIQLFPDVITLLQPTSPLRKAYHIDEAVREYRNKGAQLVVSVCEPVHSPIKSYVKTDTGELKGLYTDDAPYQPRQYLPTVYQPNGALYVINTESFLQNKGFPRSGVYPYLMRAEESIDIDSYADLLEIEKVLRN
ncbi:acylneuraminate cytidylyltransferase family protein [Pseudoalteromonas piscicida]|uniref:acylneuraminate cytidylyltransferase family protein n=1 Tax=Pseudoalteromonas piscicida TaxID=43662 RepID=UPI0032C08322